MSHAIRAAVYELAADFLDEEATQREAPLFLGDYDPVAYQHDLYNWPDRHLGHDTLVFLCPEDAVAGTQIPAYDLGGEG